MSIITCGEFGCPNLPKAEASLIWIIGLSLKLRLELDRYVLLIYGILSHSKSLDQVCHFDRIVHIILSRLCHPTILPYIYCK